jgi:hypothetical protein
MPQVSGLGECPYQVEKIVLGSGREKQPGIKTRDGLQASCQGQDDAGQDNHGKDNQDNQGDQHKHLHQGLSGSFSLSCWIERATCTNPWRSGAGSES